MKVSDYWIGTRKAGGSYYLYYRIDGKLKAKTLKEKNEKRADKLARREYAKVKQKKNRDGFEGDVATAQECFDSYLDRRLKNRNDRDRGNHLVFVKRFNDFFGASDMMLSELTQFQMEDFRDWLRKQTVMCEDKGWKTKKKLSVKTVKNILTWLSSVYRYHKIQNPLSGVERPKLTKEEAKEKAIIFYTDDEKKRIFDAAKGTVYELPIQILWHSGLRPAELFYLRNTPNDINRAEKSITVIDKKQDIRILKLGCNSYTVKAWEALMQWIDIMKIQEGKLLFDYYDNWAARQWASVLHKAGIKHTIQHVIRHQFVKYAYHTLGWSLTTCSHWCGHATDMCYATYSKVLVQSPKSNDDKEFDIDGYSVIKHKGVKLSHKRRKQFQKDVAANPTQRRALHEQAYKAQLEENKRKARGEKVEIDKEEYEAFLAFKASQQE